MDVVIVGGGATGMKVASRLRRRLEDINITVVEAGKYVSLGKCGLPFYVGGLLNTLDDLRKTTYEAVRDEKFFKEKGIEVLTETKALEIDRKRRVLKIHRIHEKEDELNYDYLVIATGSRPIKLKEGERIVGLYSAEDAEKIIKFWEDGAEKALVVGAGYIGLEVCEALKNLNMNVKLVEAFDRVLPSMLDKEMALIVQKHLVEKGVEVLLSQKVKDVVEKDSKVLVKTEKDEIEADFVVSALGVRPNSEIAEKSGLKVGKLGGIIVNEKLQTSDERIYAGGDCVEVKNLITGENMLAPFGDVAVKHGRIIADNIAGGNSTFPGVLGTSILKVFDLNVAATGLREEVAKKYFDADSVLVTGFDRSHYYPGANIIRMKLIFDRKTKRILGAQAIGGAVDKRIDVLASAIISKMTLEDLKNLDLAYSPPYSPVIDLTITASYVALNKLEGLLETVKPFEIDEIKDAIILDVRSKEEAEKAKLKYQNVVNIPLNELRKRLNELPKDKLIITVCPMGLRGYEAYRILVSKGFKVKSLEGGLRFL